MKEMTTRQAQKWLDKLKNRNMTSFKEMFKILKKYERTSDEQECFIKLNTLLLEYPDLTNEINHYFDDGHTLVVNRSQVERINDLVKYIKKVDPRAFNEIVKMITCLSNQRDSSNNEEEQNKQLIKFVLQQVKDNPELATFANKALYFSGEQLIQSLDLSHLKTFPKKQQVIEKPEQSYEAPQIIHQIEREQRVQNVERYTRRYYSPLLNLNDEKVYFRQLASTLTPELFQYLLKVIQIYQIGIISKNQALELLKDHFKEGDLVALKNLIESRETDRRRNCVFRPLSDMDFSSSERASHSYVVMPEIYPHFCSGNNKNQSDLLNIKWISVPRGSQDTFNIRAKNLNQQNLIKAEDDRYQFDILLIRINKGIKILDKVCSTLEENTYATVEREIKTLLNLGLVQILYKNCTREQKSEIQYHLTNYKFFTLNVFRQRLKNMKADLQQIRFVHGLKNWNEISLKNFAKSLDIKGHEFKRIQKIKMKHNFFLEELKRRVGYLKDGEIKEDQQNIFNCKKKQLFEIFNSFQPTSRKERCEKRKLPKPDDFELKKSQNNILKPAIILAFEDEAMLSLSYSILLFSLENSTLTEPEKIRCKYTLKYILSQFLKLKQFEVHSLSDQFDEDKFYSLLNTIVADKEIQKVQVSHLLHKQKEENFIVEEEKEELPKLKVEHGENSEYGYLPARKDDNMVFYASQNFYVFIRFLYTVYERLIKMKELLENDKKEQLFEILYYACIKCKESSKYEESLNNLFGLNCSYIFTTFYKLVENLYKSLNTLSLCIITNQSLKFIKSESEAAYIQLLNNYLLNNNLTSTKLIRCIFDFPTKILYINSLECRYSTEEPIKELQKRRSEMTYKIELYTVIETDLNLEKSKKYKNKLIKNESEYCFEGNSIKLVNLSRKEDVQVGKKKKQEGELWKQLQKNMKVIKNFDL